MNIVRLVAVRLLALGLLVAVSYVVIDATATPGDADIGAGLMAFAAIVTVAGLWGIYDGFRLDPGVSLPAWAVTAAALSAGWLVVRALLEADHSMSATEIIRADVGTIPFTAGLVLVPAALGVLIGALARPRSTTTR